MIIMIVVNEINRGKIIIISTNPNNNVLSWTLKVDLGNVMGCRANMSHPY